MVVQQRTYQRSCSLPESNIARMRLVNTLRSPIFKQTLSHTGSVFLTQKYAIARMRFGLYLAEPDLSSCFLRKSMSSQECG